MEELGEEDKCHENTRKEATLIIENVYHPKRSGLLSQSGECEWTQEEQLL